MVPQNRERLIQQKVVELQTTLTEWAGTHNLCNPGEILTIEIRIQQVFLVSESCVGPKKCRPKLPRDERWDRHVRTHKLTEKDWQQILDEAELPDGRRKVVEWLRDNTNGPISTSEIELVSGCPWFDITNGFNRGLKDIGNYHVYTGHYFRFERIRTGWYTIFRFGCPDEEP